MRKSREILGGLTTFVTMAYIIVVNPVILGASGTGMEKSGILTATVLLAFSMTLFMGLFAKVPYAVAPGMGLNAFLAYSIILGNGVPWTIALGMVFWAGVFFVLVSVTPLREKIAKAIPETIRIALSGGIGLFLCVIALKNMGWSIADPVTLMRSGAFSIPVACAWIGLIATFILHSRKIPAAFLAGIAIPLALGALFGQIALPQTWVRRPDFDSVLFKLDVMGALKIAFLPSILSIFVTDLFDSIATFVGVSYGSGLVDEQGHPRGLRRGLFVDAIATLFAGVLGTSSGTAYLESAAGIQAGARTGLASVVTAFLFLPFLFFSPLIEIVPAWATAPAILFVGLLMVQGSVRRMRFEDFDEWLPALLTFVLVPLLFSITQGILWGLIFRLILKVSAGKGKTLESADWSLGVLSALLLAVLLH